VLLIAAVGVATGCVADRPRPVQRTFASFSHSTPLRPGEELWVSPAPLLPADDYGWANRKRFEDDLKRHLTDVDRQIRVLRTGLRNGAGPIPLEYLVDIRAARQRLATSLAALATDPRPEEWDAIRRDVLKTVAALDLAVGRAKRSGAALRRATPT
jgi:hypothetical protein